MLKIEDFSRLSQVSVKTLRYYDEVALLKPTQVDEVSGYRYYSVAQLRQLHRILALRDLGFSLDQIGCVLEADLSIEELRGMLRLHRAEQQQRLLKEQERLDRVEALIQLIHQENTVNTEIKLPKVIELLFGIRPTWLVLPPLTGSKIPASLFFGLFTNGLICETLISLAGYGPESLSRLCRTPQCRTGEISYISPSAFWLYTWPDFFDTLVPVQKLFRSGREYYSLKVISTPARGFYARLQLKRHPSRFCVISFQHHRERHKYGTSDSKWRGGE